MGDAVGVHLRHMTTLCMGCASTVSTFKSTPSPVQGCNSGGAQQESYAATLGTHTPKLGHLSRKMAPELCNNAAAHHANLLELFQQRLISTLRCMHHMQAVKSCTAIRSLAVTIQYHSSSALLAHVRYVQ